MFQDGFPMNLRRDVARVAEIIPFKTCNDLNVGMTEENIVYVQNDVYIKFPYRIYFVDIHDEVLSELTQEQKMILYCLYTRSCNGYVRQKHLKSLLIMEYADWTIPYIVKLNDEYIVEILEMTYEFLKHKDTEPFKQLYLENIKNFNISYDRMVSYWNQYYRYIYKNFDEYIGRKVFKECFGYGQKIKV